MAALITDPQLAERLIAERKATGADKYDEVWDGVYNMSPLANNEHQKLATKLASILTQVVEEAGLGQVFAGANVSDRESYWEQNYRCPDVLVFLSDNHAQDRDTHWFGGPDLAIEVASVGDRSYEKLEFYAKVNTHEVIIIDRHPWAITLFRLVDGAMHEIFRATTKDDIVVESEVVSLKFHLQPNEQGQPQIDVEDRESGRRWLISIARK